MGVFHSRRIGAKALAFGALMFGSCYAAMQWGYQVQTHGFHTEWTRFTNKTLVSDLHSAVRGQTKALEDGSENGKYLNQRGNKIMVTKHDDGGVFRGSIY